MPHSLSRRAACTAGVAVAATVLASATAPAFAAPPPVSAHPHFYRTHLTKAQIEQYSHNATKRVVVLLRNQHLTGATSGYHSMAVRSGALSGDQRPIVTELRSLHATLHQYSFVNAISTTVSAAEVARLKSDPAVSAVVPDAKVTLPKSVATKPTAVKPADTTPPVNTTSGICGTEKKPLLVPEGLKDMDATTAHYGATGKGVRIAVFPDGLDPDIKDYIRPDGSHAIFDYQDFSGDGPKGVTGGGEAFGDASSIIAQGRERFDLSKVVNPNLPLPAHCDIVIKGTAPGASLAVMKVFGTDESFDSTILQGLDYAVSHDHVNVLSESFGSNPVPDNGADPVSVFNSDAVADGISVVASSGDAGVTNTIGSPAAAASGVIATGASTNFQTNAQLSEHGYQLGGDKGWESNNVSTFSSSGFTENGPNTVDVLAPGDSNWADCSTDTDTFAECANSFGSTATTPPPIEDFGGTSESCPLTAGVVALVIQAYRSTHGNSTPSPARVKEIITSSATDLGVPADEQGAGLVNAKRAVQLARSYRKAGTAGDTLAVHRQKIEKTGAPGAAYTSTVTVTNEGSKSRTVTPTLQQFGAPTTIASSTLNYNPNSSSTPTFTYWLTGTPEPYVSQTFTVPTGEQRLNARFGNPADPNDASQVVFEVLFDPQGRIAQDSDPQGAPGGFGQVEVRNPEAGTWKAIYFSRPGSDKYSGNINTSITVQKLETVTAAVSPASASLKKGASKTFTVHYSAPGAAGDQAQALRFGSGVGEVPVLTRSLLEPTATTPAAFSSELTTGNGRMVTGGQEIPYQITVPAGVHDLDVDVHVADAGYQVIGALVDPNGSPVDIADTSFTDLTHTDSNGESTTTQSQTMHLSWRTPIAGRWNLDFVTFGGSASGKTASRLFGTVSLNTVSVTSTGVPTSATPALTAGDTVTAHVTVKNTGDSPEIYYVDPRESSMSDYQLGSLTPTNGTLPVTPTADGTNGPDFVVPPSSRTLTVVADADVPVDFTTNGPLGAPEIASTTGKTAVATYSTRDVAAGAWSCPPTQIGPFSKAASGGAYACAAFAHTKTINDDVASTGGNFWDSATDPDSPNVFDPTSSAVVQPGHSTTLTVTFTPSEDEEGGTISGFLAVQTFDPFTVTGDELVHVPYSYSVAVPAGA